MNKWDDFIEQYEKFHWVEKIQKNVRTQNARHEQWEQTFNTRQVQKQRKQARKIKQDTHDANAT